MKAHWVVVVLVVGCGGGGKPAMDDGLIMDCVSDWRAGDVTMKLWGNHPDYAPDYGTLRRKGSDRYDEFRYHVGGGHLRLWIEYGRETDDVAYQLELVEDAQYTLRYRLTVDEPVFGSKEFAGVLAKSYDCKPTERP